MNKQVREISKNTLDINFHVSEIQDAYNRIDSNWLQLHYRSTVGLVVFAFIVECIMGFFVVNSDMVTTTVNIYIWKFLIVPSGLNFVCVIIDMMLIRSERLSQEYKIYGVSLILVVICFNLYIVHSGFISTIYMFAAAVMLTTIYANYKLTIITSVSTFIAIFIAEFYIIWDLDKLSIFSDTLRMGNFLVAIFILIAFTIILTITIRFEQKKNKASILMEIERQQLQKIIQVDEMTGIYNQKALHEALKNIENESLFDNEYILAIADIDNFKGINDKWGHHIGDRCLIGFAKLLKDNCGDSIPFRYGGDEFCLLFKDVTMDHAFAICEKVREACSDFTLDDEPSCKFTVSFGLAYYLMQNDAIRFFVHADFALYEAKEVKNKVCIFNKENIN